MLTVILYIAVSSDGFIADENGSVAWLDKYNDGSQDCMTIVKDYHDFYNSIDALVFGKNTYNQVLTFGPWPYPGKKSYIFADKQTLPANVGVEIVDTDVSSFINFVKTEGIKRLWLMGGAQLINSFEQLDLIDESI